MEISPLACVAVLFSMPRGGRGKREAQTRFSQPCGQISKHVNIFYKKFNDFWLNYRKPICLNEILPEAVDLPFR